MTRVRIRHQPHPRERWTTLVEAETAAEHSPVIAAEGDLLVVQVYAPVDTDVRVLVGSVLVASSIPDDRALPMHPDDSEDRPLACRGYLLADWVGQTELTLEVRAGEEVGWTEILTVPVEVVAGKLAAEQFNQLFAELQRDAAAVLLDVHGKTQIGMKAEALASSAPVAVLARVRATVREMGEVLQQMARQPASRLRSQTTREQALQGQAISETTLAELCLDPNMLAHGRSGLQVREHLREHSRPDYRLPEHRTIADFAAYLVAQLADLRQRIDAEITSRESRKGWRNVTREPGQPTWWESEDLPRVEELQHFRQEVTRLRAAVEHWLALPFLSLGQPLRHEPVSTPLFRNNDIYRRVFRVMAAHFRTYRATLDTHPLMTRARSLPVLYEWWCAVRVLRILAGGLMPRGHGPDRPLISTLLAGNERRFTIEFTSDQAMDFTDGAGHRVRFRYQPVYGGLRGPVAVLDSGSVRTPDMALEVYMPGESMPELIVVLDAKYSRATQREKMTEVSTKYAKIGDPRTGKVLSRQVWALTPVAPLGRGEALRGACTVDNVGFWSGDFEMAHPVNGALQMRPVGLGAFDPLRELLTVLLTRAGVQYGEKAP